MKKIILLSASLLVLAACTGADRPACWKANTKSDSNCNSSDGGNSSISKPDMKGKIGKRDKNNDETTPAAPDTGSEDTPTPDTNDNPSPPEDDTNQDTNPNQLNSNDVEGFDPFGGLYGPGT